MHGNVLRTMVMPLHVAVMLVLRYCGVVGIELKRVSRNALGRDHQNYVHESRVGIEQTALPIFWSAVSA